MTVLFFILGLFCLIVGAEALVRGASKLAASWGVPSLVIGLTVVAFGTSAPELAVSLKSSLAGQADIALGNAVGSNIFNILVILGLSAVVAPLSVSRQLIRTEVPLMVLVSAAVYWLALDGRIARIEGGLLLAGLVTYTSYLFIQGRQASPDGGPKLSPSPAAPARTGGTVRQVLLVFIGLSLLVVGSNWLVNSATTMARFFGINDLIIGLTVVAAGTSLPELVTSIVAGFRGERDIAVGNVIGSNLFNLLAVLGAAAVASDSGVSVALSALQVDFPVMLAASIACLPIFLTGGIVSRREGVLLVAGYSAYTAFLIWTAGV